MDKKYNSFDEFKAANAGIIDLVTQSCGEGILRSLWEIKDQEYKQLEFEFDSVVTKSLELKKSYGRTDQERKRTSGILKYLEKKYNILKLEFQKAKIAEQKLLETQSGNKKLIDFNNKLYGDIEKYKRRMHDFEHEVKQLKAENQEHLARLEERHRAIDKLTGERNAAQATARQYKLLNQKLKVELLNKTGKISSVTSDLSEENLPVRPASKNLTM